MWAVDRIKKQAETASQRLAETAARAQDVIIAAAAEEDEHPHPNTATTLRNAPPHHGLTATVPINSPAHVPAASAPSQTPHGGQTLAQISARLRDAERLNAQLRSDKEAAERQADELLDHLALLEDPTPLPPPDPAEPQLRDQLARAVADADELRTRLLSAEEANARLDTARRHLEVSADERLGLADEAQQSLQRQLEDLHVESRNQHNHAPAAANGIAADDRRNDEAELRDSDDDRSHINNADSAQSEIAELARKLRERDDQLQSLQAAFDAVKQQTPAQQTPRQNDELLSNFETQLSQLTERGNKLHSEKETAQSSVAELTEKLSIASESETADKLLIRDLQEKLLTIDTVRSELLKDEEAIGSNDDMVASNVQSRNQRDMDLLNNQKEALEKAVLDMRREALLARETSLARIQTLEELLVNKDQQHQMDLDALRHVKAELESKVAEIPNHHADDYAAIRAKCHNLERANAELQREKEDIEKAVGEVNVDQGLADDLADVQAKCLTLDRMNAQLVREKEEIEKLLDEAQDKIAFAADESATQDQYRDLEQTASQLKIEKETLQRLLEEAQASESTVQGKYHDLEQTNARFSIEREETQSRLEEIKNSKAVEAAEFKSKYELRLEEVQKDNAAETTEIKNKYAVLEHTIAQLKGEKDTVEMLLDDAQHDKAIACDATAVEVEQITAQFQAEIEATQKLLDKTKNDMAAEARTLEAKYLDVERTNADLKRAAAEKQLDDEKDEKCSVAETSDIRAKYVNLERTNAQLKSEKEAIEKLLDDAHDNMAVKADATEIQAKYDELGRKSARLESEKAAIEKLLEQAQDEIVTKVSTIEAECLDLKKANVQLKAEKEAVEKLLDEAHDELALAVDATAAQSKQGDLERSIAQLKSEKDAIGQLLDECQDEKALAIECNQRKVQELERALADKEENAERAFSALKSLRLEISSGSIEEADRSNLVSRTIVDELERSKSAAEIRSGILEKEMMTMEKEMNELRGRIEDGDDLDNLLSEMESEMADTRGELIRERETRRRGETQLKNVEALCEKLTSQLERKNQDLQEMESKYLSLEEKNIDADYQIEDLKSSIYDKHIYRADKLTKELESLRTVHAVAEDSLASIQQRVGNLTVELDQCRARLAEAEAEAQMHLQASENLQRVLEEFQAVREADIDMNLGLMQKKLVNAEQAAQSARAEAQQCAESGSRLANLLSTKEDEINKYRGDVERLTETQLELKQALEESLSRVHQKDLEKELVDRRVVRQLLISYFRVNAKRRRDVLDLIARMLEFGEDDRTAVGLTQRRLREVLGSLVTAPAGEGSMPPVGSVSEQWVEYLMHETEPDQDDGF